jgi:hypothetical protein
MKQTRKTASLLAQKIDRVAFTTYFLGAVAPLVALGVVSRWAPSSCCVT